GLCFGFSAGQMRCFQYTSSIARWAAKRVSRLIVGSPLSTASRVGAPGATVAESSSAAINNDRFSLFIVNPGLLSIRLAGASHASRRKRFRSFNFHLVFFVTLLGRAEERIWCVTINAV